MKKYENPMFRIVAISKNDVIVTSVPVNNNPQNDVVGSAADRFRDDWDAGY